MSRRLGVLLVVLVGVGLLSAGVTADNEKVLTVVHQEALRTLDPQMHIDLASYGILRHVYDPLLERDPKGNFIPMLATKWETVDDLTWKFYLRKGVYFHDGREFTSESVRYTLERLTDPATGSPQANEWQSLDKVLTPERYTVVIKLKRPYGPILSTLATTDMLPPGVTTEEVSKKPIGTGPFVFVEWRRGDRLILKANDKYWKGRPKIDRLICREIPEVSVRMSAVETGEVDIVMGVPGEDRARLEALPNVHLAETNSFLTRFLRMNAGREPFSNPKVRDAIRYALDIDAILEYVMGGQGTRANSVVAPGVLGAANPPLAPYPHDPAKARQLLAEAGYPNGFSTTMKLAEVFTKQREVAEAMVGQLARVGIRCKIEVMDRGLWLDDLLKLNWDLNLLGTNTITGDADFTLGRIYHTDAKRTGYSNRKVDELLVAAQKENDVERRKVLYREVQAILWDDGPGVWTWFENNVWAVNNRVVGFVPRPDLFLVRDVDLK